MNNKQVGALAADVITDVRCFHRRSVGVVLKRMSDQNSDTKDNTATLIVSRGKRSRTLHLVTKKYIYLIWSRYALNQRLEVEVEYYTMEPQSSEFVSAIGFFWVIMFQYLLHKCEFPDLKHTLFIYQAQFSAKICAYLCEIWVWVFCLFTRALFQRFCI